jgi:hypothetical protein
MLGNDVESLASISDIAAQQSSAVNKCIFVRLYIISAELLAPVATMMTTEEFRQIDV